MTLIFLAGAPAGMVPATLAQAAPRPSDPPADEAPREPEAHPDTDPTLTDPTVEEVKKELQDRVRTTRPVAPRPAPASNPAQARPVPAPGAAGGGVAQAGRRLPEGTFLVGRRGSLVHAESGEWIVVFHPDAGGRADPPMILLPSQTLARLQGVAESRGPETLFRLTGQVFVYHDWNYLLPTAFGITSVEEERARAAPIRGATAPPTPAADPARSDDPRVQDLIKALKSRQDAPRGLSRGDLGAGGTGGGNDTPSAPGAASESLLAEGTLVVRRRGRLSRLGGGEWVFTLDNDAGGSAQKDPPLVVAPSLNLMQMERLAAQYGENTAFEVSGRVLAYGSRNYLLPTMFRVTTPTELDPLQ